MAWKYELRSNSLRNKHPLFLFNDDDGGNINNSNKIGGNTNGGEAGAKQILAKFDQILFSPAIFSKMLTISS